MQYVMLVRVDPDLPVPDDADAASWVEEGTRSGMRVDGGPVEDPDTATSVRVRAGETQVTAEPADTSAEYVAGYDLLEAEDLDRAVGYAARHPVARSGALEVREVWADFVPDRDGGLPEPVAEGTDYLFLHVPDLALLQGITREQGDPTRWVRDVEERRATHGGFRLRVGNPGTAATVRVRDGETLVTRGPFTELAEEVAGIDRIRAADLDEAIELAAAHPTARIGAIEIRPYRQS